MCSHKVSVRMSDCVTISNQLTIQINTIHYDTIRYDTILYDMIQYNSLRHYMIRYDTIQHNYHFSLKFTWHPRAVLFQRFTHKTQPYIQYIDRRQFLESTQHNTVMTVIHHSMSSGFRTQQQILLGNRID